MGDDVNIVPLKFINVARAICIRKVRSHLFLKYIQRYIVIVAIQEDA